MPGSDGKRLTINFNYYRDGELINIKYRDSSKAFKQTAGAEKIFYGLDDIKSEKDVIIVEESLTSLLLKKRDTETA